MKEKAAALLLALLTLLLPVLTACAAADPAIDPAAHVEERLSAILGGQLSLSGADSLQAWIDGPLAESVGQGGEWYVLGLSGLARGDLSMPLAALEAASQQMTAYGAATRQKMALCVLAAGGSAEKARSAAETIGQQGIMSWVYGLHLLNNDAAAPGHTPDEAVAQLLSLQLPDGGWALMGQNADVDVTAMVLQALASHRSAPAAEEAVQRALSLLSSRQQPDGGFVGMGVPNPESGAQVLTALCALGIDPMQDERFVKNGCTIPGSFTGYALPDGGYSHTAGGEYSATATVQVFLAYAAWQRLLEGKPGLYSLELPLRPAAPDAPAEHTAAEAYSVGIIGGADGPTAVFITGPGGWKGLDALGIAALALLWCLVLFLRGKRSPKSYLVILAAACAALLLLFTLDIQSPGSYYRQQELPEGEPVGSVTLEIRCDTLPAGTPGVPADGALLPCTAFPLYPGDTVYDILTRAARQYRIPLDARGGQGMMYLAGIHYLYEQAHGELSGWMYFVNGQSASQSCDQLLLSDGDSILWAYTCEMGADLP